MKTFNECEFLFAHEKLLIVKSGPLLFILHLFLFGMNNFFELGQKAASVTSISTLTRILFMRENQALRSCSPAVSSARIMQT
jgi:hypothetical protein